MSSIFGVNLPWRIDLVFAAITKYCEALGPAPQVTQSLTYFGEFSFTGRVIFVTLTANSITFGATGTFLTKS